jgi:hypothetical protein
MIFIGLEDDFAFFVFFGAYVSVVQIGWLTFGFSRRNFLFWFDHATDALEIEAREVEG